VTSKDTGGDASWATELVQGGRRPVLLNGWHTLSFAALAAARALWARLWPLCRFLESRSYTAAVKAGCALAGDRTGPVRAPRQPLDEAATAKLATLVLRAARTEPALAG